MGQLCRTWPQFLGWYLLPVPKSQNCPEIRQIWDPLCYWVGCFVSLLMLFCSVHLCNYLFVCFLRLEHIDCIFVEYKFIVEKDHLHVACFHLTFIFQSSIILYQPKLIPHFGGLWAESSKSPSSFFYPPAPHSCLLSYLSIYVLVCIWTQFYMWK